MKILHVLCCFALLGSVQAQTPHQEKAGHVRVEAEDYHSKRNETSRQWLLMTADTPRQPTDVDSMEHLTASAGAFLELLPDTRVTPKDSLIHGENFSNEPGLSVLEYPITFETAGRYFVWVRAFSTGPDDNGIHVGIDGKWPASGQRMQWCEGKHQWTWASKQRTQTNHCGEERLIFLDIDQAGPHTIMFSMREDGFAFDAFVFSKNYLKPEN